jgi:hypothetical protein
MSISHKCTSADCRRHLAPPILHPGEVLPPPRVRRIEADETPDNRFGFAVPASRGKEITMPLLSPSKFPIRGAQVPLPAGMGRMAAASRSRIDAS